MDEVAVVDVYLKGELPSGFQRLAATTREKLNYFKEIAGKKIVYRFSDPFEGKTEKEKGPIFQALAKKGINGTNLQVKDEEGYSEKIIFPCALVHYKGKDYPINLLENEHPGMGAFEVLNYSESLLEYKFAAAINTLSQPDQAGIGYIMKPLLEVTEGDWDAVIDVNLKGCFFGVQAAAKRMIAAGKGGRIINIASQAAKSGFPHAQAYTSSKHGLVGLARSAAVELGAHQITVNNVCPNHVTTGLGAWQNEYFSKVVGAASVEDYLKAMAARIPLGRPGLPEDTAAAVAFLCSADAVYITGESMNVSGGEEPH
jgi:hypothetical protein